jgi:DHA1 family bicyclomycin/chloramphenicol resistance-like MFS transporter
MLIHPIFDLNFQRGATFPFWFASIALLGAMTSILNAKLVIIYGMRCIVLYFLIAQVVISGLTILYFASMPQSGKVAFALYFLWQTTIFFQSGLTLVNLNALAMEPMGHIAGFTASVSGGVATVLAAVLAIGANVLFNGTPLPLMAYFLLWP